MIRRGTEADVVGCAQTMERAFPNDPVLRYMVVSDDAYSVVAPLACRNFLRRIVAVGELWCFDDHAAFAAWEPPVAADADFQTEIIDGSLMDLDRVMAMRKACNQHRPDEPHWYLDVLATDPDQQSTGRGSALMAVVFERADRDGDGCYLETESPHLVEYYGRRGFTVRSEWDLPLGGPHMWGLWRDPVSESL